MRQQPGLRRGDGPWLLDLGLRAGRAGAPGREPRAVRRRRAIDLLGVGVGESDAFIAEVVDAGRRHGKQTMAYPLKDEAQVSRVRALGCTGLMTSQIRELLPKKGVANNLIGP